MNRQEKRSMRFLTRISMIIESKLRDQKRQAIESFTTFVNQNESVYHRSSIRTPERTPTVEFNRTGGLFGSSAMYNLSNIYKDPGVSINYDFNESSFMDYSQLGGGLNQDNDEPEYVNRRRGRTTDVNKSTYVTFDAQMSKNFKEK